MVPRGQSGPYCGCDRWITGHNAVWRDLSDESSSRDSLDDLKARLPRPREMMVGVSETIQTYVEFRSNAFPAINGEEQQVNSGPWGKRLADFWCEKLRNEGFETEAPFAEDWGWVVPIVNDGFRLRIGCGHYQEYPDGFLCFIEPHKAFVRRLLRKIDTRERVSSLQRAMDKVLEENAEIHSKRWWTHEEFNNPGRQEPAP